MAILHLLARRLASALIVFVGVSMLIFAIARVIPGDPARIALGPNATQEQVEALRTARHFDRPVPVQYLYFLRDLSHGDLGTSLYTHRPVVQDIAQFLPATLELVLVSGLMMIVLGLPLGVMMARRRGRAADHFGRLVALLGVCTPAFVWGVIFQLVFAYMLPLFPPEARLSAGVTQPPIVTGFMTIDSILALDGRALVDALYHLALPALALALAGIGQTARLTRSSMIEIYRRPYAEMASAYGFPAGRIAWRYVLRPALIPILTILGLDFAAMLANAFLVERVFVWPGLSRYGVEVVLRKDLDAIVGTVLIIAGAFLVANVIVDVLVAAIDPRLRLATAEAKA